MLKRIVVIVFSLCLTFNLEANPGKKQIEALRTGTAPVIDADLSDPVWTYGNCAGEFYQVSPYNGKPSKMKSRVKFVYDDEAIYVGAHLFDSAPDSIITYLSKRDELSLSDYFGIYLDPFNDGLIAYGFFVTASGVQADMRSISGSEDVEDENWDAVWESAVSIVEDGWVVEMKIPYSALRFPIENHRDWGMNILRNIRRYRELSAWNYISQEENSMNSQAGMLAGLVDVNPPMRLSFNPYAASYVNKYSSLDKPGYSLKGGLDLKYGLSESFTLDMMLIPDFGQVESDDEILNLTPFETYYDEKRGFFMEGNELFERGNIFYSRRIGGTPHKYYQVSDELGEYEIIKRNPSEGQILNATKISGKTPKGLSAGFLNAVTNPMYAHIEDSLSGKTRMFKTQELRNYNVSVLEQSLPNNSYLSIINTNVIGANSPYFANVTGVDTKLANKENSHAIFLQSAYSARRDHSGIYKGGMYYDLAVSKIRGNFLWSYSQRLETDNYNPNDLGFMRANNQFSNAFRLNYNIYEPFWKVLRVYNSIFTEYSTLYKPFEFSEWNIGLRSSATFKNYLSASLMLYFQPEAYDWYEPRVEGKKFNEPGFFYTWAFLSSDYRKKFAIDAEFTHRKSFQYDSEFFGFELGPRLRINDKLFVVYELEDNIYINQPGYVDHTNDADSIFFGLRDMNTLINTFNANYAFNNRSSLSFRIRHYWSYLKYSNYFLLNEQGDLNPVPYFEPERNFNTFNVDMVYSWFFAPGSEISFVWKNAIEADEQLIVNSYTDNFKNTLSAPHFNSISIKILYYIDYQSIKKKIAG
ncbi:MAG: DUF5916 domain-containing protein [Bacteroidota bacterium]